MEESNLRFFVHFDYVANRYGPYIKIFVLIILTEN